MCDGEGCCIVSANFKSMTAFDGDGNQYDILGFIDDSMHEVDFDQAKYFLVEIGMGLAEIFDMDNFRGGYVH